MCLNDDCFLSVRLEASQCPEVVVAHIDPKKLKKKQTVNASVSKCEPQCRKGHWPVLACEGLSGMMYSVSLIFFLTACVFRWQAVMQLQQGSAPVSVGSSTKSATSLVSDR